MRRVSFLFLFSLAAGALWLPAQTGPESSILGIVKDQSEAVIPGAEVKISNAETGLTRLARTDSKGYFEVLALPRGTYAVVVSSPGFQTWQLTNVVLTAGEQKRVAPILRIGQVAEQVTVEAAVELMQTEKVSVETAIEQKQVRDLPLNGRNPIEMVNLTPGMRFQGVGGLANEHTVAGNGQRNDQTQFTVDGLDANDPSNEKGFALPNLETVAQFSVQTSNFSAEYGRNPLQILMVTKSGTNAYHGTLWEFHRNFALDARNASALTTPKLIRNQFGFSAGGPVLRNRTFFFSSYEGTTIRQEAIYNSPTIAPEMLQGDFSSLSRRINDPLTRVPFPNNKIPEARFSNASKFFFPHILLPNAADSRFRTVAPVPSDNGNFMLRIDQELKNTQRLYARWVRVALSDENRGYRPEIVRTQDVVQHNLGLNYNWNINATTLFTLMGGYVQSDTRVNSAAVGKENLTARAGIQGFPTEGREDAIGLPSASFTASYAGFSVPQQVPGRFRREDIHARAGVTMIRGKHSVGFGYEYNDRRTLAGHSSSSSRGVFTFGSQYTSDGFADYLLGLVTQVERNFPLKSFGMGHSPYSAVYVNDYWRAHPNVTINVGLRYDRWHEKVFVRNNGATFDLRRGKVAAGVDENGNVDLTAQPTARFLAEATRGLWITATEAGMPRGLFESSRYFSPRVGAAWRPMGTDSLVLRGGYGIFTSSYNGNITGSQVIGPPYWSIERQTFSAASLQRWETAFPQDPRAFVTPSVAAALFNVKPMKIHEFNVALQKSLRPLHAAVTVSYVGSRGDDLITRMDHNEVPAGNYTNLQAAKPFPQLGTIRLYENIGRSWYNALQVKMERRFTRGFGYGLAYAFARHVDENGGAFTDFPIPFAPEGYNRGRSELERRHTLTINAIRELPFGRGRAWARGLHPVAEALVGGWQLSGIYNFTSGNPLSLTVPGNTLGNGFSTRPNLVGDPRVSNPSASLWFNPAAFEAPPRFAFGNSGLGLIDAPGVHGLNLALMKDFHFTEAKYLQFRWELFNMPNHVNLGDPVTQIGLRTTGTISSAGDARQMQFGLKFIF